MLEIYTDGAYHQQTGSGGWAWTTIGEVQRSRSGREETGGSPHNMEAIAVLEALQSLEDEKSVSVRTDCLVLVEKLEKARRTGGKLRTAATWQESFEKLTEAIERLEDAGVEVHIEWVKGHAECEGNRIADRLARTASKRRDQQ